MLVKELVEILNRANPNAKVKLPGQGFTTDAGTWLEDEPVDLSYVAPAPEFLPQAKEVYLQ